MKRRIITFLVLLVIVSLMPSTMASGKNNGSSSVETIMWSAKNAFLVSSGEFFMWSIKNADDLEVIMGSTRHMPEDISATTLWDTMKEEALAHENNAINIASYSASDIQVLNIESVTAGVVLAPTDCDQIILETIGVNQPEAISIDHSMDGETLTVKAQGLVQDEMLFVSLVPGHITNAVRISIPKDVLESITIKDQTGLYSIADLARNISGSTDAGFLKVEGGQLQAAYDLGCESGTLLMECGSVASSATLSTRNGDCVILADSIEKAVMTAGNGDLIIRADTVTDVSAEVGNGDILSVIGTIGASFTTRSKNGDILIQFKNEPENLQINMRKGNGDVLLPTGWKDGYKLGNGGPTFDLQSGNGDVIVSIGG